MESLEQDASPPLRVQGRPRDKWVTTGMALMRSDVVDLIFYKKDLSLRNRQEVAFEGRH